MSVAYADASCLVAVAFDEPGARDVAALLSSYEEILASSLLEAELLAALARENVNEEPELLSALTWIFPDRSLGPEIRRTLAWGYIRGADVWHLATALYVAADPSELPFLTLDQRQRDTARALGFPTP